MLHCISCYSFLSAELHLLLQCTALAVSLYSTSCCPVLFAAPDWLLSCADAAGHCLLHCTGCCLYYLLHCAGCAVYPPVRVNCITASCRESSGLSLLNQVRTFPPLFPPPTSLPHTTPHSSYITPSLHFSLLLRRSLITSFLSLFLSLPPLPSSFIH